MTPAVRTDALTPAEVRWAVAQATRAPSIHNTQPWRFRCADGTFTLIADTERGLTVTDPDSRELVISCGAALFNLRLALRKLDRRYAVELLPDRTDPRVLATVTVTGVAPATVHERRLFAALIRRHTHRGPFDGRAISADLAVALQQEAAEEGALLLYVNDPGQRHRVLHLTRAAERLLSADERVRAEIEAWTPAPDSKRKDGIPADAYPVIEDGRPLDDVAARDFDLGRHYGKLAAGDQPPGAVAVLASVGDLQRDWFAAGQALERMLVTAAEHGASAAMHSQAIEVPHIRQDLRRELATAAHPQLVLRFGYTDSVVPTPRRPAVEVIDPPARWPR